MRENRSRATPETCFRLSKESRTGLLDCCLMSVPAFATGFAAAVRYTVCSGVRGMTVVYLDRVFVLNGIVDYLLLLGTAWLCGLPLHRKRLVLCAALGGLYAAVVFLPRTAVLGHPVVRVLAGGAMALLAFQGRWRPAGLFFLLAAGLAGAVLAAGLACGSVRGLAQRLYFADISWQVLILVSALFYAALRLFMGQAARHMGGELLQVRISVGGRTQVVTALHDTGNTLRDPVSGCPALVLERRAADMLWTPEVARVLAENVPPEVKMARLHRMGCTVRFTLLPFRAVGTEAGLLLAARSDYIEVNGRRYPRTPVALCEQPVSDGGGYHALWGAEERGERHEGAASASEKAVAQDMRAG